MKKTRERMKAELMMEAESAIDAMLDQHERWEEPTLRQIEDVILDLRQQLSARMAEVVLQGEENVQPAEAPICPNCGQEMTYKGEERYNRREPDRGCAVRTRVLALRPL